MKSTFLGPDGVISAAEANNFEVLVYGASVYRDHVVAFDSIKSFESWLQTHPSKDRILEGLRRTDAARQLAEKDPQGAQEAQRASVKETATKVDALARKIGSDPNSLETFLKATVDADPITGPVFRSGQLFDEPNFSGRRLDLRSWQWYFDLNSIGFNDIVSSVRVHPWSVVGCYEHAFFGGRWRWFFGGLWWDNEFQLDPELNNKVSSCFCVGF
jgi:hypothetical protein